MITVKGKADADWSIVSHIIDLSTPNIEFENITFDCKTIKDASGHIFVRQKAGEWIPVSERLPKECDGSVLVSKEDGQVTTGLHSEFSDVWYIGDMCGVGGCKVIAWMPLPMPYREDGEA